jgi:hypothetical protein
MRASVSSFITIPALLLFAACGSSYEGGKPSADSELSVTIPADTIVPKLTKNDSVNVTPTPTPAPTEGTGKEVTVNEGIVYYTRPYCGGARPTEEIEAERKKSILLMNTTLKMKNKAGVVYVVTTNDKGIFRSGIPAGQYDVYVTEKTNKTIYNVSPETCENCLTEPLGNVIIRDGQQASFTIHFRCGPNDKFRP